MNGISYCRLLFGLAGGLAAVNLALQGVVSDVLPPRLSAAINAASAGLTAFTAAYCVGQLKPTEPPPSPVVASPPG